MNSSRFVFCSVVASALLLTRAPGQAHDATPGVPVRIWGSASGAAVNGSSQARLEVTATDLLGQNGSGTASLTLPGARSATTAGWFDTTTDTAHLEPGKVYTVSVNGAFAGGNVTNVALNLAPPVGYEIEIDQYRRNRSDIGAATHIYQVRVMGRREREFMSAGACSDLSLGRVYWQVGVGSLRNGTAAGSLTIVDPGLSAAWTPLYTPSALQFEPSSDEIVVLRSAGGALRQVLGHQAFIDIVILSATSYEIAFYHPAQVASGSGETPRTFTGQPYVSYRLEQGATATSLKITRVERDTSADNSWTAAAARTTITSLTRAGSTVADYVWTRKDWNVSGATQVAEQITTSAGTVANRSDTVVVRPDGDSAPEKRALQLARTFKLFSWGEEILSSTAGSSNPMTSSTDYYDNTAEVGRHGFLKQMQVPGGGWEAYDYWDATATSGTKRIGTVRHVFRPFGNAPAAIGFNETQGEVTIYDYSDDPFGWKTRPSSVERKINNATVARSATAYAEPAGLTVGGAQLVIATRSDYTDNTTSLATTTKFFREDVPDFFVRGQIYSVTQPDNVRVSYAYQRGTFNEATREFAPSANGAGSRIAVITGTVGSTYTADNGFDLDDLALIDGKSTREVVLRDDRALVRRKESHAWLSGAWALVAWTNYDYDTAGHLTQQTSNNGATYAATFSGDQKKSETDASGVRYAFDYDNAGRLWKIKKLAVNNTDVVLVTTLDYDPAGRVTTQTRSAPGTSETLADAWQYDDAGRLKNETPAGLSRIDHTYAIAAREHTVTTTADGATRTTTYQLDGRVAKVEGTGVVPSYFTYDVDAGKFRQQLRSGSTTSSRLKKEWFDWLGRSVKTEAPGFSAITPTTVTAQRFYDDAGTGLGRLFKEVNADLPPTRYNYDELGQMKQVWLDANNNGALDLAGPDRVSEFDLRLGADAGHYWLTRVTKTFPDGVSTPVTLSTSRTRLTGFAANTLSEQEETDAEGNKTTSTVVVNTATKTVTQSRTLPGAAAAESVLATNGLPVSQTNPDGLTYDFTADLLERRWKVKDPRHTAPTVVTYYPGTELVQKVTDPAGFSVAESHYDGLGRLDWTKNAAGKYVRSAYNLRGQLTQQWGDGTYPVEYGYDPVLGDRTQLKTFRTAGAADSASWPAPATPDVTTWTPDAASGLLWKKIDAKGALVEFDYNVRGQPTSRKWARKLSDNTTPLTTTYQYYAETGELWKVLYNDDADPIPTPDLEYTYTQLGQPREVIQSTASGGMGTTAFAYDPVRPWRLVSETLPADLGSRVLTRLYESATSANAGTYGSYTQGTVKGRLSGFELGSLANPDRDLRQAWTFSNQPRFAGLSSAANEGAAVDLVYAYKANSALLDGYTRGSFTVSRDYEANRDLVTRLETSSSAGTVARFDYTHDALGRRESVKRSGAAFGVFATASYASTYYRYGYNARNELESARLYGGNDPSQTVNELSGRRFEYRYDSLGNRRQAGGTGLASGTLDTSGSGDDDYETDELNRYTRRENNRVEVSGTVASNAAIGMAGKLALPRVDRTWSTSVAPDNALAPAAGQVQLFAAVSGNTTVRTELRTWLAAKRLQAFDYDADGNLTGDGIWVYTWNAENQLVRMTSALPVGFGASFGLKRQRLDFRYDAQGRRVEKKVTDLDSAVQTVQRFVHDGWNLVAELKWTAATSTLEMIRSYAWGLDLTGSPTASGGVGALVQITTYAGGTPASSYYPTFDASGNLTSLVKAADGSLAAIYEYDPFGQTIRREIYDPAVADQPFGFSTKYTDAETSLIYYGQRYYSPSLGRFVNRDPIEERGGTNLFSFCLNDGINRWDYLGQFSLKKFLKKYWKPIVAVVAAVVTYGVASSAIFASGTSMTVASTTAANMAAGQLGAVAVSATAAPTGLLAGAVASGTISATTAGVVAGAVGGAAAGAVSGAITTGTVEGALQGAAGGVLGGAVTGYFGNAWTMGRVAATTVASGIGAELSGGEFADGALIGGAISLATYGALEMRTYELQNSPRENLGRPSAGFNGDVQSVGGVRDSAYTNAAGARVTITAEPGLLGGRQGSTPGTIFGSPYPAYSVRDRLVEAYGGVHDFFNRPWSYDPQGYNDAPASLFGRVVANVASDSTARFASGVMNWVNVPLSTPIVAASIIGVSPGAIVSVTDSVARRSGEEAASGDSGRAGERIRRNPIDP